MTKLGEYFEKKSINKASVARKTGISKSRLSQLSLNASTRLTCDELQLISLAIEVPASEILNVVSGHLSLSEQA